MEIKNSKKQLILTIKTIISILFSFIDIPNYLNLNKVYHILLLTIKILKIIKVKNMEINQKLNKIIGFMLSHYKRIKICSMSKEYNSLLLMRYSKHGNLTCWYHFYLENNEISCSFCYFRNKECILSKFKDIKL